MKVKPGLNFFTAKFGEERVVRSSAVTERGVAYGAPAFLCFQEGKKQS